MKFSNDITVFKSCNSKACYQRFVMSMPFQASFLPWGNPVRSHRCFLFVARHKTVSAFGQGPRTRTLLDCIDVSLGRPLFQNIFQYSVLFFVFSFSLISFTNSATDSSSTLILETRRLLQNLFCDAFTCQPLLSDFSANHLKAIFFRGAKIIKKAFCLDKSVFSNFAVNVITFLNRHFVLVFVLDEAA